MRAKENRSSNSSRNLTGQVQQRQTGVRLRQQQLWLLPSCLHPVGLLQAQGRPGTGPGALLSMP